MDATDLRLILGRSGLSARRLHAALAARRIGAPSLACVEDLVGLPSHELASLGLPPAACAWLAAPDARQLAQDRRWHERHQVRIIDSFDARYPRRLAGIADAPALLYVRGDPAVLQKPQLAIVGTRSPTLPGRELAHRWAAYLARAGLVITSGLALGIDAAAHEGALNAQAPTVAVLGTGVDRVYPTRHASLARRILGQGALVSELPPGTAPVRWSFPRRNRMISGLACGTLVVEAASDSGSLLTAQCAIEQRRLLFAIPGSVHNPQARGCHRLLREGAHLAESADDVLRGLAQFLTEPQDCAGDLTPRGSRSASLRLDKKHKILLDALGFEAASIDALVTRTGFSSSSVASMLLFLQLCGAVGAEPGGRFVRLFATATADTDRHG